MLPSSPQRSAFTLLEVILVMVLIVIISAAAYPTITSWYGDARVRGAADELRASWADARAHAIDEGVAYRFSIIADQGRYKIAPDSAEYWENATDGGDTDGDAPASGTMVIRKTLPSGIRFALSPNSDGSTPNSDPSGWTTIATFLPDGTCKEDVTIEIDADQQTPLILRIRGLTGTVTTQTKRRNP